MSRRWLDLPRPVWLLGWVSFFADMASEMVYPLLPLFLTRVLGAVAGPLIASSFLYLWPGEYRILFALTIVPGLIVILVLWGVPEGSAGSGGSSGSGVLFGSREQKGTSEPMEPPEPVESRAFWKAMTVIFLFTLGNASDAFLLLRLSDLGIAVFWIPVLWSALHVVKSVSSIGGGVLSDRLGRRMLIGLGWILYACVYAAFAVVDSTAGVVSVFLSYGLYFGLTEGVEKAWVADLTPASRRGTAFGIYNGLLGAGALIASVLFGYLWTRVSPDAAFLTGSALALAATGLLYFLFPGERTHDKHPGHQR
jgi:predicted MFS family arabinose efflux permease